MKILLTGVAGFIGMHAALRLLQRGDEVVGIDNLTPYYEISLKRARLAQLAAYPNFRFIEQDLADLAGVQGALGDWQPQRVLHLAAQPGVRYSIDHPHTYAQANLVAFLNVLADALHGAGLTLTVDVASWSPIWDLPALGAAREVKNLFLWSRILDARRSET